MVLGARMPVPWYRVSRRMLSARPHCHTLLTKNRGVCHRLFHTTTNAPLHTNTTSLDAPLVPAEQDDPRIMATLHWFRTIVIGEKLCPFAPPFQRQSELMKITSASPTINRRQAIALIQQESQDLVGRQTATAAAMTTITTSTITTTEESQPQHRQHETTLVILDLPEWSTNYREFVRFSWDVQEQVIEQGNLNGILQLVLFHPLATHQTYTTGSSPDNDHDNAGDYTIRSPYPTIHLLREVDVLRAVQGAYPNLETLPARNQAKMIQQGIDICRQRLRACYHVVPEEHA